MASAKDRGGGEMCPHSKPGPLPMAAFLLALLCGDEKLPPFPCANRVTRPPAMCMGPAYGVKKISPMAFQCMFDTSNINFRIATIQFQPPPQENCSIIPKTICSLSFENPGGVCHFGIHNRAEVPAQRLENLRWLEKTCWLTSPDPPIGIPGWKWTRLRVEPGKCPTPKQPIMEKTKKNIEPKI